MFTDPKSLTAGEVVSGIAIGLTSVLLLGWLQINDLEIWLWLGIIGLWVLSQVLPLACWILRIDPCSQEFWMRFNSTQLPSLEFVSALIAAFAIILGLDWMLA